METKKEPPKLVIRRVLNAKRERVFDAWTKPEMMSKWFYPGVGRAVVTNDLRVGGAYQNKMIFDGEEGTANGCGLSSDAKIVIHEGEYLEISPPEKIVFTWNSPYAKDTRVTIDLRDLGDSTELILTHEFLETEESRSGHNGGWDGCLENLAGYLGE